MSGGNPFVGPRPLGPGDPIFGRDREIRELRSLLSSERIALLCSPSGAGKSSLVSAGLIPQLTKRFDIWLPTRVNLAPPASLKAANRYAWSAAAGFEQELPEDRRRPLDSLLTVSLKEYVQARPRRHDAPKGILLIFDQFEEILRIDPVDVEGKVEFFRQLGDLLEDPNIWALFVLREDFLAPLDPYCKAVPTYLRYRYRIDLLGLDAAREAIAKPAAAGGKQFSPDAAEKLLADLSAVRAQQPDGSFHEARGLHVEPLQLQVVCRGLWDRLPEGTTEIRTEHVEKFGDATKALAGYYTGEVARIGGGDVPRERSLREWTDGKLITRDGIRSLVMRGAGSSEGLDNNLVAQLVDTHLVRAEQRAGTVWYELAHDRLVEPVRRDNATWRESHLAAVQRIADIWADRQKPAGLLLTGAALREAKRWAEANPRAVTSVETEFLLASSSKHRAEQIRGAFLVAVMVLAVAATVAAVWAVRESRLSRSRELAARAMSQARAISPLDRLDGLILALGAMDASPTQDAPTQEAMEALDLAWQLIRGARFTGHTGIVNALRWSRDGRNLVSGGTDGTAIFWNPSTGERVRQVAQVTGGLGVEGVAFSEDDKLAATAADDGRLRVLSASSDAPAAVLNGCDKPPAMDVAFGAGSTVGAACGSGFATVWNAVNGRKMSVLTGHEGAVNAIRFGRGNRLAATAGNDGQTILWDIDSGRSVAQWKFDGMVTALQFSPDGRRLAAARLNKADGTVAVWDTVTKANVFETMADGNGAFSVDFSGDGTLIAVGGLNGDVKLWQTDRGEAHLTLFNAGCDPGGDCRAHVAFAPSAKQIAIASGDKIWLHDLDFASVRAQAIAKLKQSPDIQKACRRLLQSDSCPGF